MPTSFFMVPLVWINQLQGLAPGLQLHALEVRARWLHGLGRKRMIFHAGLSATLLPQRRQSCLQGVASLRGVESHGSASVWATKARRSTVAQRCGGIQYSRQRAAAARSKHIGKLGRRPAQQPRTSSEGQCGRGAWSNSQQGTGEGRVRSEGRGSCQGSSAPCSGRGAGPSGSTGASSTGRSAAGQPAAPAGGTCRGPAAGRAGGQVGCREARKRAVRRHGSLRGSTNERGSGERQYKQQNESSPLAAVAATSGH